MPYDNRMVPLALHIIFLVIGSAANIFILTIHFLEWLKTRKINSCDLIINCIVIINLFLQGSITFNQICVTMFVDFVIQVWVINSLLVILISLAFSSLWCCTCLCFYYCVKIVNISGTLFNKLKLKLPKMVPWLLVFSNAISWAAALPAYWDIYKFDPFSTSNVTGNMSSIIMGFKSRCNCLFQFYMVIDFMAFIIIFITAGAIIVSLCKHMSRIKKNNEGFGNARLSSHIIAARTVTSLLVLFSLFYGALNVIYYETEDTGGLTFIVCLLVCSSFPSINAIILITGNRKLSNMLRHLFGMTSTSGNSEVIVTIY